MSLNTLFIHFWIDQNYAENNEKQEQKALKGELEQVVIYIL
jgi:hypothetical protein